MGLEQYLHKRYGKLTVIDISTRTNSQGRPFLVCRCDCGNIKEISVSNIRHYKSCGCLRKEQMQANRDAKIGTRYGHLVITGFSEKKDTMGKLYIKTKCDCGEEKEFTAGYLQSGNAYYCGNNGCQYKKPMKEFPFKDLSNQTFGNIRAIRPIGSNGYTKIYECECLLCGRIIEKSRTSLLKGKDENLNCGCIKRKSGYSVVHNKTAFGTNFAILEANHLFKNNTSGVTGVSYCNKKSAPGWYASCQFQKARVQKLCKSYEDAVNVRNLLTAHRDRFLEWYRGLSVEEREEASKDYDNNRLYFQNLYKVQAKELLRTYTE